MKLTILRNGAVFAPERLGLCDLVIAGERILYLAPSAKAENLPEVPEELVGEEIDLEGRTVIPGLIDGHVHVTGGGGESGFASRVPSMPLSRFTSGGVTTVIGLLGTDDLVRTPASVLAAVRGLREEGLSAWCFTGGYHFPVETLTGSVRGDIVHLEPVIGVGEVAISDHRSSQPSFDELLRLASDAHVAGLMTGKAGLVHLHMGDGPRGLKLVRRAIDETELPPSTLQPTHVNRRKALFEEALELARRGVPVDVTAFPVEEGEDAWTAEEAVQRYLASGAPFEQLTVSSDAGGCLPVFDAEGRVASMDVGDPGSLLAMVGRLEDAGVPLETALAPVTENVARALRLPRKGSLGVGQDADLVILEERFAGADKPPKPISASWVMARGQWHRRDGEQVIRGTFELGSDRSGQVRVDGADGADGASGE